MTTTTAAASHYWSDGTQAHHWFGLDLLSTVLLEAMEAELAAAAPPRLNQGDCVHDRHGFAAFHRLRAFYRARIRAFGRWPIEEVRS
jgi:hypothetical protein